MRALVSLLFGLFLYIVPEGWIACADGHLHLTKNGARCLVGAEVRANEFECKASSAGYPEKIEILDVAIYVENFVAREHSGDFVGGQLKAIQVCFGMPSSIWANCDAAKLAPMCRHLRALLSFYTDLVGDANANKQGDTLSNILQVGVDQNASHGVAKHPTDSRQSRHGRGDVRALGIAQVTRRLLSSSGGFSGDVYLPPDKPRLDSGYLPRRPVLLGCGAPEPFGRLTQAQGGPHQPAGNDSQYESEPANDKALIVVHENADRSRKPVNRTNEWLNYGFLAALFLPVFALIFSRRTTVAWAVMTFLLIAWGTIRGVE